MPESNVILKYTLGSPDREIGCRASGKDLSWIGVLWTQFSCRNLFFNKEDRIVDEIKKLADN